MNEVIGNLEEPEQNIKMKWISIKDDLPEEDQYVLVTNGKLVEEGYFSQWNDAPRWGKSPYFGEVTHWMPLPEKPNEIENPLVFREKPGEFEGIPDECDL